MRVMTVPVSRVSRQQAARMLSVSERQILGWQRAGLAAEMETFSLRDLARLRSLCRLTQRLSLRSIRASLVAMQAVLGSDDPLQQDMPIADRCRLVFRYGGALLDPLTQQLGFDFEQGLRPTLCLPAQSRLAEQQSNIQAAAQELFRQAVRLEEQAGKLEAAEEVYRQVLRLWPEHAAARINLGTILYNARQYHAAEENYRAAIEIDPEYALAFFDLGNVLDELTRLPEAIAAYQRAVQLVPQYADAHYNLALAFERTGERRRALRHWLHYLRLDPVGPWATHARMQARRTLASERLSIVTRAGKLA